MNNNKRKWPINTVPQVRQHSVGILYAAKQTPISFGNSAISKEFHRLNPIKPNGKWNAILSGNDVVSSRKRSEIRKGTYTPPTNNTKKLNYFMR